MSEQNSFIKHITSALVHFLYNFFLYFIFIVPFDLWRKATIRLSLQREQGGLKISEITSLWPLLSFIKIFIFEFLIDGIIFISYIIGPIIAIIMWLQSGEIYNFITVIFGAYFSPTIFSLIRDFLQLLLLPFAKFLSWVSKPAQFMNLEIKNQ